MNGPPSTCLNYVLLHHRRTDVESCLILHFTILPRTSLILGSDDVTCPFRLTFLGASMDNISRRSLWRQQKHAAYFKFRRQWLLCVADMKCGKIQWLAYIIHDSFSFDISLQQWQFILTKKMKHLLALFEYLLSLDTSVCCVQWQLSMGGLSGRCMEAVPRTVVKGSNRGFDSVRAWVLNVLQSAQGLIPTLAGVP